MARKATYAPVGDATVEQLLAAREQVLGPNMRHRLGPLGARWGKFCEEFGKIIAYREAHREDVRIPKGELSPSFENRVGDFNSMLSLLDPPLHIRKVRNEAFYRLTALSRPRPLNGDADGARLVVFPDAERIDAERGYGGAWLGYGGADDVKFNRSITSDIDEIRRVPITIYDSRPHLQVVFRHTYSLDPTINWWCVVLALSVKSKRSNYFWHPIDGSRYTKLAIHARARHDAGDFNQPCQIHVGLRFEDCAAGSRSQSGRQSTDWHEIILKEHLDERLIDLEAFNWGKHAWRDNTAAVNRTNLLQLTIGQEGPFADCEGCIEVAHVELR